MVCLTSTCSLAPGSVGLPSMARASPTSSSVAGKSPSGALSGVSGTSSTGASSSVVGSSSPGPGVPPVPPEPPKSTSTKN